MCSSDLRIYGLRMLSLLEDIPMRINKVEDVIRIEAKGKTFDLMQGTLLQGFIGPAKQIFNPIYEFYP